MPIELFRRQCFFTELFTRWCFSQMVVLLLLRGLYKDLSFLHKAISCLVIQGAHRRKGREATGNAAPPPPPILGNSDFLVSKKKFGQSQFLRSDVFMFFYYCFEEIYIFYFSPRELGVIIQLHSRETVVA